MGSNQNRKPHRPYQNTFILHFRPRSIPERTLKFNLTWGLGGMASLLVALLIGTGLLLKFYYLPSPEKAYESILYLEKRVLFGQLIRNIHHWSANLALVVVFLHFIRVFLTGAFHPPRRLNWVVGLGLFLLMLLSNFTGYLLPWDQLSYWAVTISVGMLEYIPLVVGLWLQELIQGGPEVGPATLSNFYAIHTAVLPGLLIFFMLFHFWRVRKAKGVVIPRAPGENPENHNNKVPAIPHLLVRELTVALALIAFVLVFSILFDAPLQDKANPGLSPNPTKAPWYFMGIQELLLHFHPLFSLFIIPLCMSMGLFILPYLRYPSNPAGIWLISIRGRRMALMGVLFAVVITMGGILLRTFVSSPLSISGTPGYLTGGLLPFMIVVSVILGYYMAMKRLYSANRNEAVQTLLVFLLTSFVILTVIGIWFRGAGMKLVWP